MAVNQVTNLPAVSLPNGASNLPNQLIPMLEKFDRIYLWMDNDEAGQINLQNFATKLGLSRTYIVRPINFKIINSGLDSQETIIDKIKEEA